MSPRPLRGQRWVLAGLLIVTVPTAIVKRLDEDNRFCVACHLHERHLADMTAVPAVNMAGVHATAKHAGHPDRCFTCHSGEGVLGWTQVTVLSAWDAARWVLGDRNEPTRMRLPLTDQACLKCHVNDVRGTLTAEETQAFHQLTDHRGLTVACIACHQAHPAGERARTWLRREVVRPQCARCHRDMADTAASPSPGLFMNRGLRAPAPGRLRRHRTGTLLDVCPTRLRGVPVLFLAVGPVPALSARAS